MSDIDPNQIVSTLETTPSKIVSTLETVANDGTPSKAAKDIAVIGLIVVTAGAVGALAYRAVVQGDSQALTQVGTFGTLGLGGLLALVGGSKKTGA